MTQSDPHPIPELLRQNPLFAALDDTHIATLTKSCSLQSYTKGKTLFLHEAKADFCYLIQSGWVKLFRETIEGDQAILTMLSTQDIFGEAALFNESVYPYGAEIVEDATLVRISLPAFQILLDTSAEFARAMLDMMARDRKKQHQELEHRTLQNAPQRIGCFLLGLTQSQNTNDLRTESMTLNLPYDKALIASHLGMQPETFSRALTKLKQATDLHIDGSTVHIASIRKLSDFSCRACTSGFPCKDTGTAHHLTQITT